MTTTGQLGFMAVVALIGAGCSAKDNLLRKGDGAVDQQVVGTGGSLPGTGGSGGSVTGAGGAGTGGMATGTGGVGTGGTVIGTGGSGKGGSGGGGTVSTGGNGGGTIATGGAGGQGGTGQGGSTRVDAAPDVAVDASQPDCPATPSGTCSLPSSTICYYGSDPRWFCKTSAKCSQGTWVVSDPMPECTATPDPSCPADPASAPVGICSPDGGTKATCVYSTQYCKCGFTGGPNPGWVCSKSLPAECPALPPGDGSSCTTPSGVWCTYGPACSGHDMQCVEGKWVTLLLACG